MKILFAFDSRCVLVPLVRFIALFNCLLLLTFKKNLFYHLEAISITSGSASFHTSDPYQRLLAVMARWTSMSKGSMSLDNNNTNCWREQECWQVAAFVLHLLWFPQHLGGCCEIV